MNEQTRLTPMSRWRERLVHLPAGSPPLEKERDVSMSDLAHAWQTAGQFFIQMRNVVIRKGLVNNHESSQ